MSYLLGGLASGIGAGITQQAQAKAAAEADQRDRNFQVALENLRAKNNMASDANRAELNDRSTEKEYGYKDQLADRDLERGISKTRADTDERIRLDDNTASNDIRLANVRGAIDRQNDEQAATLRAQLESGEVVDTFLSESGEYVGITKRGFQVPTGVFAHSIDTTPRPVAGLGGSMLWPEEQQQQPTATPSATPAPARSASPTPTPAASPPAAQVEGVYRALTDQQAEEFVNDPANKGKRFMAPDGKVYTAG